MERSFVLGIISNYGANDSTGNEAADKFIVATAMMMVLVTSWWWSRLVMAMVFSPIVACITGAGSMAFHVRGTSMPIVTHAMRRTSARRRRIVMLATQL